MSKKEIRAGGKITRSHATVTRHAGMVVDFLKKLDVVTKISLGKIQRIRSRGFRLKFKDLHAGLLVTVYSHKDVQEIRAYTFAPRRVEKKFKLHFI